MSSTLDRWKIEAKVAASTVAAAAVGIAAAVLNDVEANHALLGSLPPWLQAVLLVLVPPLASFAAGYQAKHSPRPDPADAPALRAESAPTQITGPTPTTPASPTAGPGTSGPAAS